MVGAAVGGYTVMHAAPTLEYPASDLRPQPDVSCHNLEMGTYLVGRSGAVAESAAIGGPVLSTMLNPAAPTSIPPNAPGSDGPPASPRGPSPSMAKLHERLAASKLSVQAASTRLAYIQAHLILDSESPRVRT